MENSLKDSRFFDLYNLSYSEFAEIYHWSTSTIRYWFAGRSLPKQSGTGLYDLKEYLYNAIKSNQGHDKQVYEETKAFFLQQNQSKLYFKLCSSYPNINQFMGEVLSTCFDFAKHNNILIQLDSCEIPSPTGKTQVVVFDFDGTLTSGKTNKTTWESIWMNLGYSLNLCQDLHMQYDRGEITHSEWCKITEKKFRERNLHRDVVDELASKIKLMKGTRATFHELQKQDIRIYIVSGSIHSIIRRVLGNLNQYIEGIKANQFRYNQSGFLTEIVGTKYDFEGKAEYITKIALELNISVNDILFIGNSLNDRFAYISGARTLCINPKLTDATNRDVWHDCIQTCDSLTEIFKYL